MPKKCVQCMQVASFSCKCSSEFYCSAGCKELSTHICNPIFWTNSLCTSEPVVISEKPFRENSISAAESTHKKKSEPNWIFVGINSISNKWLILKSVHHFLYLFCFAWQNVSMLHVAAVVAMSNPKMILGMSDSVEKKINLASLELAGPFFLLTTAKLMFEFSHDIVILDLQYVYFVIWNVLSHLYLSLIHI